jgi:hypothetical protein
MSSDSMPLSSWRIPLHCRSKSKEDNDVVRISKKVGIIMKATITYLLIALPQPPATEPMLTTDPAVSKISITA